MVLVEILVDKSKSGARNTPLSRGEKYLHISRRQSANTRGVSHAGILFLKTKRRSTTGTHSSLVEAFTKSRTCMCREEGRSSI